MEQKQSRVVVKVALYGPPAVIVARLVCHGGYEKVFQLAEAKPGKHTQSCYAYWKRR